MKLNLSIKTILVVEDYLVMRNAIKDMLYTLGAQYVFEAESGSAAISAMKKQIFDIVLCDYKLGAGKNGQQVLEEARYNKLLPAKALFIIVSGHQTVNNVLCTIETKPDEYLAKPFNAQQLSRRLEKSYQRKHSFSSIEKEIEKGNLVRAINHCDELLYKNVSDTRSQLLKIRAELAIKAGDLDTASAIYEEKLEQREISWARLGTGIIAFCKDDHELAITTFQNLIELNPMLLECYDWLVKSYEAIGNINKAEEILIQATELSPDSLFRQKKLALLADKTRHIEVAEKAYKATTELGEYSIYKSPSDFSGLAKTYSKQNEKQEALKILDEMRHQFIKNPEAELRAASLETEVYLNLGETKLSQQAFQQVQKFNNQLKDKSPIDLQIDVAKACYLNDDIDMADKIISSLIHNYIDDNSFMDDIRQMQRDIGKNNYSEALIQETRQKLIKINNQGVELFHQGHLKKAFAIFEKAVEKMPNNKTIIFNMAKISLHDLKTSGITEENLLLAHRFLERAKKVGVSADKLGNLQIEFEKITHASS